MPIYRILPVMRLVRFRSRISHKYIRLYIHNHDKSLVVELLPTMWQDIYLGFMLRVYGYCSGSEEKLTDIAFDM